MLNRLVANWVYGGFMAGVLLLLLAPVIIRSWSPVLVAVFLCLPVYMVHQYEEHDNDRFRRHFNETIGRGREVLSPLAAFITNVPGVWGVVGLSIWLTATANIGFGLIACYLLIVNAAVHVISGIMYRGYNPGLATGLLLFLPLGGYGVSQVSQAGGGPMWAHLLGAGSAIAIHVVILIHVQMKGTRLARFEVDPDRSRAGIKSSPALA
jgi:hypothetical protein